MAGSKAVYAKWVGTALVYYTAAGTEIFRIDGAAAVAAIVRANGSILSQRFRKTIAEINAGVTLLAALGTSYKYRLIDAFAIAIGGNAGAVTTVDLLGTQTTSQKLVAFAQAQLTRSAIVRAGATGGTVLADGASFVACDANTAITAGKTGSDITTATHVDFILSYAIDLV